MAKASTVADCHVLLSLMVSLTNVANVNDPLGVTQGLWLELELGLVTRCSTGKSAKLGLKFRVRA